jgi:Fe-S-cluster containining protein
MPSESRFPLPVVELAAAGTSDAAEVATADVRLKIGGAPVHLRIHVPTGLAAQRVLLPVLHGLAEVVTGAAVRAVEQQGKSVSCRAGCGACCRQLVPVAPSEARDLARLVAALPEPRRSAVLARFADALGRLEEAGLGAPLRGLGGTDSSSRRAFALAYFRQGVACPFLEDESCSIHPDRPLACREFLVTSPAEECARPEAEAVEIVPVPTSVAAVARELDGDGWVPLVLALEWAAAHAADEPGTPGVDLLRSLLARLTGATVD